MLDKNLLLQVLSNVKSTVVLQAVVATLSGDYVSFNTTSMGKELLCINYEPIASLDASIKENLLQLKDTLALLKTNSI